MKGHSARIMYEGYKSRLNQLRAIESSYQSSTRNSNGFRSADPKEVSAMSENIFTSRTHIRMNTKPVDAVFLNYDKPFIRVKRSTKQTSPKQEPPKIK